MQVVENNIKELVEWCGAIQSVMVRVGEPSVSLALKGMPTILAPIGSYLVKEPTGEFKLYSREQFQQLHLPEKHWDERIHWPAYDR